MFKKNRVFLTILIIFVTSCKQNPEKTATDEFHCLQSENSLINIEGTLNLDSKGNALVDFVDSTYNGKIKIVGKEIFKSIYSNYDAFLSLKNIENCEFNVLVYGHYVTPIDTNNWVNKGRDFHAHTMSFGYEETNEIIRN